MFTRTVSEEDLVRLKRDRETADRRYNDALTELDAAVQPQPELPHPPPGPDELQVTPLNERWNILAAARPMPTGLRGRLARFVWGLLEPIFSQQQAFNSALVDHVNRNVMAAREVPRSIASTIELARQQAELAVRFQSRLIVFAQQVTPFVDTKDYEFHGISRRMDEDALDRVSRAEEWLGDLRRDLEREIARLDTVGRGIAGGVSGLSDEMLKRFESATARDQRFEAGLGELTGAVASVQQLTQMLRRDLERRIAGTAAQSTRPSAPTQPVVTPDSRLPTPDLPSGGAQQLLASDPIHSHQYVGFEDLYRGSEIDIRGRMTDYARVFEGASDVLDIGCGRGEFLTLLREHGVTARGIDLNHEMVARCQADGLDVAEADALSYLNGLPDESLGGLIATQVVEHLPPDYLLRLLTVAFDKLRPNARIVLETINPASWAAFFDSYIRDLTHMRPVHPDTLKYLVTASGFADAAISWRSPYPAESKLRPLGPEIRSAAASDPTLAPLTEAFDQNVERLNGLLFTYMDYAIIARRP
jgi:SAM-dependent methyltransferase